MCKVKKVVFKHAIEEVKTLKGKRPKSKHRLSNAVARVERADVVGIGFERSSVSETHRPYS